MKLGKLAEAQLKRSVLKQMNHNSIYTESKPSVGVDSIAFVAGEKKLMTAVATVSVPIARPVRLAIIRACNNVAVGGAKPIGVSIAMTLPEDANETMVRTLWQEAKETGLELIGGQTELSRGVKWPIICVTAYGYAEVANQTEAVKTIQEGMDIVMTKWAGMEATYLLAENKQNELEQFFAKSYVSEGIAFGDHLSVCEEARILTSQGICAMHDVSTGGVFAALWEILSPSGLGCHVDLQAIPIKQETIEYAEVFHLNPYMIMGSGSLLCVTSNGEECVSLLEKNGIYATIIGKTTKDKAKGIFIDIVEDEEFVDPAKPRRRKKQEQRFLEQPKSDEMFTVLEDVGD